MISWTAMLPTRQADSSAGRYWFDRSGMFIVLRTAGDRTSIVPAMGRWWLKIDLNKPAGGQVCAPRRVLCADATSVEAGARLLGDCQPLLLVTDPLWHRDHLLGFRSRPPVAEGAEDNSFGVPVPR